MLWRFLMRMLDYTFLLIVEVIALVVIITMIGVLLISHNARGTELMIASTYSDGTRDPTAMTAAHKTLPFGTQLTLTHARRVVVVRINDRGPFIKGRALDLTPAANKYLQCGGLCRVRVDGWPPLPRPKPDDVIAWGAE